jgi:tRNA threonylcarbamoyladenosine biosynthesis protein TsaB
VSSADDLNLVAIETATETVGVAVRAGSGLQAALTLTGGRRHVESLTPALEHLLGQVGLEARDLHAVAVDLGPGLFTGLRVGVAAAKGLAQALEVGVIGASSLDILLAAAAAAGHRGLVVGAVDARRGEVFASLATIDPAGAVVGGEPPRLVSPDALATMLRELEGAPVLAIGDGSQRYADVIEEVPGARCARSAFSWPPPSTLLALAAARLGAGETPADPAHVVPLYMREADARVNFTQVFRN